jgi:YVTN family beta-propeller protein
MLSAHDVDNSRAAAYSLGAFMRAIQLRRCTWRLTSVAALFVAMAFPAIAQSDAGKEGVVPSYHITKEVALPGPARWDFVKYSSRDRRVYVAHGDRVSVVDEPTGKLIGQIGNLPGGTHGIAIPPQGNQGFTDEGHPGLAVAFNLKTLQQTATVATAADADGILYEPTTKHIYVINGDSGSISVIDPSSDKKIATIDIGAKLEPAVADGKGRIYVNGEQQNDIVAIDAKANKVIAHWPMPACQTPHGIAIDRATRRLFSTCANKVLVVLNIDTGGIVATLPIGAHSDGAAFDPVRKLVFSSNGDGTLSVIKELPADHFITAETVKTKASARTISIDPKTGRIFLVAADLVSAPTTAGTGHRPAYAPDSVKLLYVDPTP